MFSSNAAITDVSAASGANTTAYAEAVQTRFICSSYIPLLVLLVPLEHAAHAQGLGTESDICSHTSGSLAAPVFCPQRCCSYCCVPAGGSEWPWNVARWLSPSTSKCISFPFPPHHSLRSSVQMLMIHPKGYISTRCRLLRCEWRFFFFHLRLELSWLPETALTTSSTCQCVSQVTPPTRPLSRSQLPPFLLRSLYRSPIRQSLVLNHLYSELYLDFLFLSCWSQSSPLAHFSLDSRNYVQIKAITGCRSGSEGEITVRWLTIYLVLSGETDMWAGWWKLVFEVDVF